MSAALSVSSLHKSYHKCSFEIISPSLTHWFIAKTTTQTKKNTFHCLAAGTLDIYMFYHVISYITAAAAKSLQSCLTLCDPVDDSPPGSPVPGILQARTLEWVAISFSNACECEWRWKVKVKLLSRVRLLATPWTAPYQAPPPMGFSRHGCWSGCLAFSPYITIEILFRFLYFIKLFRWKVMYESKPLSWLLALS